MSEISFTQKGDFSKVTSYLERIKEQIHMGILNKYGRAGVEALSNATPKDTGKTAASWYYDIEQTKTGAVLSFCNSNVNKGENIAILIQYGHGTGWGGYVVGQDYINPALRPLVEQIAEEMWKEVTKV